MVRRRQVVNNLKVLGQRSFWSFQVIHALLGGALTVGGAIGAIAVGDGLQRSIVDVDARIAEIDERLQSIGNTLVQFRVVQSNGLLLSALASGDAIREDLREPFTRLTFVLRRTPALSLVQELYPADLANFNKDQAELDSLHTRAVAPGRTAQDANDFLNFEMTREKEVMELQSRLLQEKFDLRSRRSVLQVSFDRATSVGLIIQQVGFVIILLAGLVHQHVRREIPAVSQTAPG